MKRWQRQWPRAGTSWGTASSVGANGSGRCIPDLSADASADGSLSGGRSGCADSYWKKTHQITGGLAGPPLQGHDIHPG